MADEMSDSPDPDDLSAFIPESSDSTAGVRRGSGDGDKEDDWLAVFTTEPRSDTTSGARAAALASPDEDLLQFPPDEYLNHSLDDDGLFLDQFPEQPPVPLAPPAPAAQRSSEPWAGPWAAAVVAVGISVLLGTRSLYPAWWNAGAVPPAPLQVSTPVVEPGVPSETFRHFDVVAVDVPRRASASVQAAQSGVTRSAPAAPRSTLTAETRPNGRAVRVSPPAALVAERTARVPTVELMPLAPIAPGSSGAARSPEEYATPLRPEGTLTSAPTPKVSDAAVQEYAVRTALHSYEQAYEALDVAAAAAIWPSVDRRALARAFDTLKYQGLNFKSCAITVMDGSAIARCRGTLEIVRKIGSSMPLTAEQEWVFKMRRLGKEWKIDDVAASQEHGLVTQRTRTQG